MKKIIFLIIGAFYISSSAYAAAAAYSDVLKLDIKNTNVRGYTKKNGSYVAPHQRTSPNKTQRDNWTSKPNSNPYTGKQGTKEAQR